MGESFTNNFIETNRSGKGQQFSLYNIISIAQYINIPMSYCKTFAHLYKFLKQAYLFRRFDALKICGLELEPRTVSKKHKLAT